MKRLLTYIIIVLVLGACTGRERYAAMRNGLDSINQRNRNGQPFTMADVQPYVDYFDRHGNGNDRLLAHYLLGRAYYDHGEAPMALQCYQDAADCADTTAADCDYAQLARVYGQMAQVFYSQGLYQEQLQKTKFSVKYAWKGKDTLAALMSYEQESQAYRNLNMPDSLLYICEHVSQLYRNYGYPQYAASALFHTLRTLIVRQEFIKAKQNMQIYESESEFFDSLGNIQKGREIYYKSKGLYFFYTNKLDSAEYYFRKEICEGKDFNNQHAGAEGLSLLYKKQHFPDSVVKYSLYAYAMSDSLYKKRAAKEVERIQAMYNYSRHQEVARKESERAALANRKLLICFIVLLAVLLLSSWLYIARKKMIDNLQNIAAQLDDYKRENYKLKQNASANQWQIAENEKRISQLEKKLGKYSKLVFFGEEKMENDLKLSPNYQQLEEFAYKGLKLSENDWDIICNLISEYFPGFYDFLLSNLQVNSTEYHICLLLRLHFKTGEIANMLGVTPPYISKISTEILANLFGKKASSKELSKELSKIK